MPLFLDVNKNRVINWSFVSFIKAIYFIGWKQQQHILTKHKISAILHCLNDFFLCLSVHAETKTWKGSKPF